MSYEVDVAIVGGGLAGLTSARDVQRAGLTTIVLEARDRVGGRVWGRALPGGEAIEAGAQFVGPTQDRILELAKDLGVATYRCYDEGERYVSVAGRDDVGFETVVEAAEQLERMAAELPLDAPWTAPRAQEWDGQTFRTWLDANVGDPVSRALMRLITTALFTSEPDELSLLHVLVYIRSAGSLTLLTQTAGGAQERRFVGGSHLVAERLADRLGPEAVQLRTPVRSIGQTPEGVIVEADELTVSARRAIVAVPVAVADRLAYDPPLSGYRAQMHQRMSPGATIKANVVYETPFWRDAGHSGRSFSDEGPVSVTFDNTPASGAPGVLAAFAEADAARHLCRLAGEERRAVVLDALARVFGPRAHAPLEYMEQDWSSEEWTRGCYGANFGPGGWTRYGEALREPFGLVHWAGTETATTWMNYMDGAVGSGERAAREVVAVLAPEVAVGSAPDA